MVQRIYLDEITRRISEKRKFIQVFRGVSAGLGGEPGRAGGFTAVRDAHFLKRGSRFRCRARKRFRAALLRMNIAARRTRVVLRRPSGKISKIFSAGRECLTLLKQKDAYFF